MDEGAKARERKKKLNIKRKSDNNVENVIV